MGDTDETKLLALMAATVASGMVEGSPDPKLVEAGVYSNKIDKSIADRAMNIAKEILARARKVGQ